MDLAEFVRCVLDGHIVVCGHNGKVAGLPGFVFDGETVAALAHKRLCARTSDVQTLKR